MRLPTNLLLPLALLVCLTACGDDSGPAESQAASPLPEVTSTAPAGATTAPSTTEAPAPTAPTTGPTTAAPTASPTKPAFPKAVVVPEQGGRYFAVYLAVARGASVTAENTKAEESGRAVGFDPTSGDVDCEQGAREGLKLGKAGDYIGTSLFFSTAALAKQFVDAFEPGVVGTAEVKAFCLD